MKTGSVTEGSMSVDSTVARLEAYDGAPAR
jgi:hypothetical protein